MGIFEVCKDGKVMQAKCELASKAVNAAGFLLPIINIGITGSLGRE